MMRAAQPLTVALAICAVLAAPLGAASKPAPDVTLRTANGDTVRLADLKGRVVLVDFWASWCAPCKTSFPALDALFREYRERGVEVLAVNVDEQRHNADAFLAERPYALTVLFDPSGASAEAFGVEGMPSSFIVDREGAIRFTHMGYSGSVEASYRQELDQLLSEHPPS
jgi:peroxiredoxin